MIRLFASLLSALLLSLVFTMISQNNNTGDNVLYYSFANEFFNGFMIIFCIYLIFVTPISFYIDRTIRHRSRITRVLLYFIIGAILAAFILVINAANHIQASIQLMLLFGLGAAVFSLFVSLFTLVMKRTPR